MELRHQKTFIGLFMLTLIIVIGILFHEQGIVLPKLLHPDPVPLENISEASSHAQQVLGENSINTSNLPVKKNEYDTSFLADHLTLTPANIIWMTNYERIQQGMQPLHEHELLKKSAYAKNGDMQTYQYFNHTNTRNGESYGFDLFMKEQHYDFIKIGENLAEGDFQNTYELVQAWMKSPEHRRNILDKGFRDIGVSVFVITNAQGSRQSMYVQHFGVSQDACPRGTLNTLQDEYHRLEALLDDQRDRIAIITKEQGDPTTEIESYNATIQEMDTLVVKMNKQVTQYNICTHNFF